MQSWTRLCMLLVDPPQWSYYSSMMLTMYYMHMLIFFKLGRWVKSQPNSLGYLYHLPVKVKIKVGFGFRADVLPEFLRGDTGPGCVVRTTEVSVFALLVFLLGDQLISREVSNWVGERAEEAVQEMANGSRQTRKFYALYRNKCIYCQREFLT